MAKSRLIGEYPVIGIRPTIDGRRGPLKVRESLEEQTMNMAKSAAELISKNLKDSNGEPVKVGAHMYYQVDLEVGDKYQYTFELDEQLVNSVDNFYAIVAPVGLEGEIDKTDTVIFIDEYRK